MTISGVVGTSHPLYGGPGEPARMLRASLKVDYGHCWPMWLFRSSFCTVRRTPTSMWVRAVIWPSTSTARSSLSCLVDDDVFVGGIDGLVDEIEDFLTGRHQPPEVDVVLATVLFTDIVDSTPQAARLGHRTWSQLSGRHDAVVRTRSDGMAGARSRRPGRLPRRLQRSHSGGRCAIEIVTRARAVGVNVRAGLHTGEIEIRDDDIGGLAVTIAKRICDLAGPAQVLISETVKASSSDLRSPYPTSGRTASRAFMRTGISSASRSECSTCGCDRPLGRPHALHDQLSTELP